ncbi:glycosyltransferase [Brucella inopinata]|uniref:glycosyltransferase n=1 Tax=Brucella inopinata TaxID=1218315 RepID=UPI000870D0B8|nr:glycosyltransferase [Brucella inopinata]SCD22798.1 hypothetical protein BR141012304_10356 [Brucella inopinata]
MTAVDFRMPTPAETEQRKYGNLNIPHQFTSTPQWNYGAHSDARLINDIFNDGLTSEIVWQPDTYHSAKLYSDASSVKRIIDIGCGSALKLKSLFENSSFEVFAVDFAGSLSAAKENYPSANHVECDLTSWNEVLAVARQFRDDIPTVVICADVIEHLPDPRPLLALIRLILSGNSQSRSYLSTPDRARLGYQSLTAKPANPAHVREWTNGEFRNLIMASGFQIENIGNIRSNVHDEKARTILVECAFDPIGYNDILKRYGINMSNVSALMLTTEYPGLIASGGIGTFVADWHRSNPSSVVLTVFDFEKKDKVSSDSIISPSDFIDSTKLDNSGTADMLLEVFIQVLFMCPDIEEVHFQEYLGIGARIAQAKRAGILPDSVATIVHCHGNQHYLENANQFWFGGDTQGIVVREKVAIELADFIVFPSIFLREFYRQSGVQFKDSKVLLKPYRYPNIDGTYVNYELLKKIVFVGKFMPMKGFDLFCSSFDSSFCAELKSKGVEEIVLIGRGPSDDFQNKADIRNNFELSIYSDFELNGLVSYLKENRSNSLFVEPYRADNFPLAVYDVVANGGFLLAGNAGGIPEMFRIDSWKECLSDLTIDSLRYKIRELIDMDIARRAEIVADLKEDLRQANCEPEKSQYFNTCVAEGKSLTATVMIPFYNTDISEFTDLLKALNQQSMRPSEVIIVNDASNHNSRMEMVAAVEAYLTIPFKIIDHAFNCGLAGARNTALAACETDVILNADSDDVPLNDWVKTIVEALSREPLAACAVPYLEAFDAGTDFNKHLPKGRYVYRPLGDGFVTSQTQNDLGHANSGYRVSSVRMMGGWNAASKAKYEDWAFFLNVIANGFRIAVIPKVTCMYRVRKNSMVRTYSDWPGEIRLYQTSAGLSRFEALQLQRLCRNSVRPWTNGDQDSVIAQLTARLEAYENRKIIRILNSLSARTRRFPLIQSILRKMASLGWNLGALLKRNLR